MPAALVAAGLAAAIGLGFASTGDGAKRWRARAGRIEGSVSLLRGVPPSSLLVTLDGAVTAETDGEGRFAFEMVPPGDHLLSVRHLAERYRGEARVRLRPGETASARLDLWEHPEVGSTAAVIPLEEGAVTYGDIAVGAGLLVGCDRYGFKVYDVGDPRSPLFLASSPGGSGTCDTILLDFPYLYMGWKDEEPGVAGLKIYSLEDPTAPWEVSRLDAGSDPYKLHLDGGLLFGIGRDFFQVFDVADPARPELLSSLPFRGEGVTHRDGIAYLGTEPRVLVAVDVSDPRAPEVVWESPEISLEGHGKDCVLRGRRLWVGRADSIYQYDVLDPREPRLVNVVDGAYLLREGAVLTGGSLGTGRVDVTDRIAYYSGRENGLIAVDYQDALRPRFAWQSDELVVYAMNVAAEGDWLYLAGGPTGMTILTRR